MDRTDSKEYQCLYSIPITLFQLWAIRFNRASVPVQYISNSTLPIDRTERREPQFLKNIFIPLEPKGPYGPYSDSVCVEYI